MRNPWTGTALAAAVGPLAGVAVQASLAALASRDAAPPWQLATSAVDGASLGRRGGAPVQLTTSMGELQVAWVGGLANRDSLRAALLRSGVGLRPGDGELLAALIAQSAKGNPVNRVVEALWKLSGGFCAAVGYAGRLMVVRDPAGVVPAFLGRLSEGWLVATEPGAVLGAGAELVRSVRPGELLVLQGNNLQSVAPLPAAPARPCGMETLVFGSAVGDPERHALREKLGEALAQESPAPAGAVVVGLPPAGLALASGFARASRLETSDALLAAADGRLVCRVPLTGRVVALVSPAFWGGGRLKLAVNALRQAGAAAVHLRVASPAPRGGCPIDLSVGARQAGELLVASQGELSLRSLREALGSACLACLDGQSPFERPSDADQLPLFRMSQEGGS